MRSGDPGTAPCIVLGGRVNVRRGSQTGVRPASGQFCGEMTLVDGQPWSAKVNAVEPAQGAMLAGTEFWKFAKREPGAPAGKMRKKARRLRNAEWALSE